MNRQEIIQQLPYDKPFLFVDALTHIDENSVTGTYTFHKELDFYKGHLKGFPVTPGVILTEVMAQIGLVCLGIYLMRHEYHAKGKIPFVLTSTAIEFIKAVFPGEKVTVMAEKIYFRFGKLKCRVVMKNESGEDICTGTMAGMLISKQYEQ